MVEKRKQILVYLFCFWLSVSCALLEWPTEGGSSSVESTEIVVLDTVAPAIFISPVPDSSQTEIHSKVTPNPTVTSVNITDNPEQTTDGKLKMFLKEFKSSCYKPGDAINLIITYENLTNKPLSIVDYDFISAYKFVHSDGFLAPIITTVENNRIFTSDDYKLATSYNPDTPVFLELPTNGLIDINVEYYFPFSVARLDEKGNLITQAVSEGQYFLKFVYIGRPSGGSWEGAISSNQIQICIVN